MKIGQAMEEMIERLAKLIIEKGALKFGDFTLASGRKSDYYIDGRIIALYPEGAFLIGTIIEKIMRADYPDAEAVGGMIAGAVPVATAAARASHDAGRPFNAFMVRKEIKKHGTQKAVEGPLEPGRRVVVVDDVVTTGGSTVDAIDRVEDFGCEVIGIICVVDREEEKIPRMSDYKFSPILTITQLRALREDA